MILWPFELAHVVNNVCLLKRIESIKRLGSRLSQNCRWRGGIDIWAKAWTLLILQWQWVRQCPGLIQNLLREHWNFPEQPFLALFLFKSGKLPSCNWVIGHLVVILLFEGTNCGVLSPVPQHEHRNLAAHSQECWCISCTRPRSLYMCLD